VLLRVETHNVRRDVDQLLAHPHVSVADENPGVVHGLRKTQLEDLGLEAALLQRAKSRGSVRTRH
jgi:hypothetical protein